MGKLAVPEAHAVPWAEEAQVYRFSPWAFMSPARAGSCRKEPQLLARLSAHTCSQESVNHSRFPSFSERRAHTTKFGTPRFQNSIVRVLVIIKWAHFATVGRSAQTAGGRAWSRKCLLFYSFLAKPGRGTTLPGHPPP